MYFNVRMQENIFYIIYEMKIWKQNIWVESFNCTLVAIELQLQKNISHILCMIIIL
jgi:hypothetical protein